MLINFGSVASNANGSLSSNNAKTNQIDFVLGKFMEDEYELLLSKFDLIAESLNSYILSGIDETMNNYNN